MADPKLTASPSEVKLAGQSFTMTPLTDKEFGEFENWLRQRPIRIAMDHSRQIEGLNPAEKETLLKQAMEISNRVSMSSTEGLQIMATLEGAAFLTWLSLRKHQPELTPDKIQGMFTDDRTISEAMTQVNRINNLDGLPIGKKRGPFQPRRDKHKKRKRPRTSKTARQMTQAVQSAVSTISSPSPTDGAPPS